MSPCGQACINACMRSVPSVQQGVRYTLVWPPWLSAIESSNFFLQPSASFKGPGFQTSVYSSLKQRHAWSFYNVYLSLYEVLYQSLFLCRFRKDGGRGSDNFPTARHYSVYPALNAMEYTFISNFLRFVLSFLCNLSLLCTFLKLGVWI